MEKLIVFNYCGTPAYTTESNYNSRIMDASKITTCRNFSNLEQLKEYLQSYASAVEVK